MDKYFIAMKVGCRMSGKRTIILMLTVLCLLCRFCCAEYGLMSYTEYSGLYKNADMPLVTVQALPFETENTVDEVPCAIIEEGSELCIQIDCPADGSYRIGMVYYPLPDKGLNIEFSLMIDGAVPFSEAAYNTLYRIWADDTKPGEKQDAAGNDIIPGQHEEPEWTEVLIADATGTYSDPYLFYLSAGKHELTVRSNRESFAVCDMYITNTAPLPSYEEVSAQYAALGYEPAPCGDIVIEAENTLRKSDTVLYGRTDRSSPLTTPYSTMETRINTIGGSSWNVQGQWIEWKLDVPADGLYYLAMRARQDVISGSFTTRRIYIDGQIPFAEFGDVRVNYDMQWQNIELPYAIYLTEGKHVLRMEATIGDLTDIVAMVDGSVSQLNEAYRRIVMITGTTPDTYRDYMLEENVPEVFVTFEEQKEILKKCDELLVEKTGKRGSMNGILQTLSQQLEDFCEKPETVQKRLSNLKDNVGSLGSWLTQIKSLPLEIDKIYLRGADSTELPEAEAGFFAQLSHEASMFASSFKIDYSVIGTMDESNQNRTIEVWVSAGRDQANIIKQLIENSFTPETGITVNLKLVQGQLMNATASGVGPDVVLQLGNSEPVNYAVRGAAYDLTQFDDFDEVVSRFRESALVPYELEDGIYALPETQTFTVMFYRTDVLEELGIDPPETWEEMFSVVGRLQRKNMTVGIQPPNSAAGNYYALSSMAMLLYQRGGEMYTDGNKRSGLGSEAAKDAFSMWVSLYADYELPVKYDALTRFRSGEMPIVIEDFTFYNFLQVGAPEIRGRWAFMQVPGTVQEDGSVDHSVTGYSICTMMMADAEDKDASWEFMKWWLSADIQTRYGRDIENQLGVSARYPSANIEAFANMPWSVSELQTLNAEWDNVKGIPEVPGGYFTSRHLNNAFHRVLNQNEDPGETLLDYVKNIDEEITSKRREFGLEVYEGE